MEFVSRRERALAETKAKLRETLTDDQVLIHVYRSQTTERGIDYWLAAVLPEHEDAHKAVKKNGHKEWPEDGHGAHMREEHWELLVSHLKGKTHDLESFVNEIAPNLTAVCGAETAAELISAAGGLTALSRLTQRDCQCLGNESGSFGGKDKDSIMECHELATSDRALRILCSRAVLAARIDAHNGEFKGDKLHQEVLYAQ